MSNPFSQSGSGLLCGSSLPPVPSPDCVPIGDLKRYALVEVDSNQVSSNASEPVTNGSSNPEDTSGVCPANPAPFFSRALDEYTVLPAVGGFFQMTVCDTSQWKIGMWLDHPLGKFPITNITASLNQLTLRNSCDDGSPIPNNSYAGSAFSGTAVIYPTQNSCTAKTEAESIVIEVIEEAIDICPTNVPDISGSEKVSIAGGLAECIDTCTGSEQEGTRCLRFAPQAFADVESLLIPAAPELTLGERSFNGITAPTQLLQWDPSSGKIFRVDIPSDGDYGLHVEDGVMTLASRDIEQLYYSTPPTVASGQGSSTGFDLNSLSGVTVPSWATHAVVECHASVLSLSGLVQSKTVSNAVVNINGRLGAMAGSNDTNSSTSYNNETSASDTNTTYAKLDAGKISFSITETTSGSRAPQFNTHIKLIGFTTAQIA